MEQQRRVTQRPSEEFLTSLEKEFLWTLINKSMMMKVKIRL